MPTSVGEAEEVRLVDGVHHLDDRSLDDLVLQRRDTERPLPPIRLRDVHPSRWLSAVHSSVQPRVKIPKMGLHILAVPRPRHAINSRCGLGVDPLVRSPEPVDGDVVQERGELRILVAFSDLTYPRQRTVHASPALCPVRVLSPRVSLGRTPFLPTVRRSLRSFVPVVRRYYGSVRLLIVVHHGVTALALPTRLAGP